LVNKAEKILKTYLVKIRRTNSAILSELLLLDLNSIDHHFKMPTDKNTNIFRDLATLLEAGISVLDAAKKVAASHPSIQIWRNVISALESGQRLNKSLAESKLICNFEQEIISVSEFSGRLPQGLRSIADSYDKRRSRVSTLKSKLYFPSVAFVIGIIILSIQTNNNSDSSAFSILANAFFWLALVFILTRTLLVLMKKDACVWLQIVSNFSRSQWYKEQLQQIIFGALLWQIKSGIDFKTGFLRITKLLNNKSINKQLKLASTFCNQGRSVSQSIIQSKLPITSEFKQILLTGEQSGQWEFTLDKYLQQQARLLEIRLNSVCEWVPRIYYALIALFVITVIF